MSSIRPNRRELTTRAILFPLVLFPLVQHVARSLTGGQAGAC